MIIGFRGISNASVPLLLLTINKNIQSMKTAYQTPHTVAETTMTVTMLCASGAVTPPVSHDTQPVTDGGDPNNAI